MLVLVIKPGVGVEINSSAATSYDHEDNFPKNVTTEDNLMDLVRNLVPSNIVQAWLQQRTTELRHPAVDVVNNVTRGQPLFLSGDNRSRNVLTF